MMKLKKELVPKRRFEGYLDRWENLIFEDITSKIGDGLHGTPQYKKDGKVFFINGNNLVNGRIIINEDTKRVSKEEQSKDDKTLCENTILMSINGTIGNLAWYNGEELMLGKSVAYMQIKEHDKRFIYSFLQTDKVYKYFINSLTGSTIKNLGLKAIRETTLWAPHQEEQQKIGQFFKHLDEMIALQQREIDKTKALKSAYLAEMFPAEGERVPKRRFAGFTDEWKPLKLIEFVDKAVDNRGKTPPLNINGSHPLIEVTSIGDGPPDYSKVEKYLDDSSFQNNLRDYIKKNDILFSTVGRIGLVSLMDEREDAAIAQNIVAFRAKESYVPEYIYALFSTEQSKIKAHRIVMGAVQPSIKVSQLIHNEYYLPTSRKEQKQIGNFFKHLDDTILIHQQKLEKLKATKQAYLHEMFV